MEPARAQRVVAQTIRELPEAVVPVGQKLFQVSEGREWFALPK